MKEINPEQYRLLLERNCNRSKHRLRTNKFGVTWCVICGLLSTSTGEQQLEDNDSLLVQWKEQ